MATTKLRTVKCACGCSIELLDIDAIYGDDDLPYFSLEHMGEAGMDSYLDQFEAEVIEEWELSQ